MESPRWDLLNLMVENRSILINNQSMCYVLPPFYFLIQNKRELPKTGVSFVWILSSLRFNLNCTQCFCLKLNPLLLAYYFPTLRLKNTLCTRRKFKIYWTRGEKTMTFFVLRSWVFFSVPFPSLLFPSSSLPSLSFFSSLPISFLLGIEYLPFPLLRGFAPALPSRLPISSHLSAQRLSPWRRRAGPLIEASVTGKQSEFQ